MMKRSSFRVVMLLALAAGSAQAEHYACEGPLQAGSWFIKPKIGVAPTVFASHRAHQQFVVPRAAQQQTGEGSCEDNTCNVNNFANTLQEGPCLPKFSDMFHQGVLHVGVELGYNVCDRSPWFLEFVYNRASGDCHQPCEFVTAQANAGCPVDDECVRDCRRDCKDDCCPTGDSLSNICNVIDNYDDYQAYGGYIGGRYFTDPFWCDSTAWFFGYKVGILHRQEVEACTTLVVPQDVPQNEISGCPEGTETQNVELRRNVFCKSNSVSGGVQMGFDYCYNDCLSFQLGFEVVASCGLRGNKNYPINLDKVTNEAGTSLKDSFNLPSNVIVRNTGAVVNFPVWFGMKWEFGNWCDPCDPCA